MKILKVLSLFFFLAFFIACDNVVVEPIDLIGGWSLDYVSINGIDSEDINSSITAHYLQFEADNSYYRTYVTGDYEVVNDNIIRLTADYGPIWEMEVVSLTANTLIVKMEMTEVEYNWNFPEFTPTEPLAIVEKYVKSGQ